MFDLYFLVLNADMPHVLCQSVHSLHPVSGECSYHFNNNKSTVFSKFSIRYVILLWILSLAITRWVVQTCVSMGKLCLQWKFLVFSYTLFIRVMDQNLNITSLRES